jgi:hypothetical protein
VPSYDVRAAALALDIPYRSLDVLLARHDVPGVSKGGQGVSRRVSDEGLLRLAVADELWRVLQLDVPAGLALADGLISAGGELTAGDLRLTVDLVRLRARLASRMTDVIERVVPVRRGRPPKSAPPRAT